MKTFEMSQYGKTVVVNLDRGELMLESIEKALAEAGVKNAVLVSGIGSFSEMTIHIVSALTEEPHDLFIHKEAPIELGCMQGIVVDGKPHIHIAAVDPDGTPYVGHLEPGCKVLYLAELCFLEIKDMELTRVPNAFGVGFMERK